ncbi:hypothetical protein [Devosia sp. 1635]|uniref:hypothetical protein n=1 Tax=Devosia sp. 1635 TaxID=2726066 RepID=UPI0015673649|nr:hypothetical protein [Devosia sp. 1635]
MSPLHSGVIGIAQSKAAFDVLAERRRQIEAEGWTPDHDDEHRRGQLSRAAAAYAYFGSLLDEERERGANTDSFTTFIIRHLFPSWGTVYGGWDWHWWKPKTRREDLVRAGALILAEIERLDRDALKEGK